MPWWRLWKMRTQGADVDRLRAWRPGEASLAGGDFRYAQVWGGSFNQADLSQANLTHANLRRTTLKRSRLQGSRLNHADLEKANLDGASLRGAELIGVNLRGASLQEADLRGVITRPQIPVELQAVQQVTPTADLSGADLRGADLGGADLSGVDLSGAALSWANLSGADLTGADLSGAELSWSCLVDADLSGAELRHAAVKGAACSVHTKWPKGFAGETRGAFRMMEGRGTLMRQRIMVPGYGPLLLRQVPSLTFWRGADPRDGTAFDDEKPGHTVHMSRGFLIGETQVTQGLYKAVMGANPSHNPASDQHPVEGLSWLDAARFCNRLSRQCGLDSAYTIGSGERAVLCRFSARGFRLPTEAEWECAAKAGQPLNFSGSKSPDSVAWYQENSGGRTRPVGQRKPNAWGLYDLSGNVYEWVWDWYDRHSHGLGSGPDQADPTGPADGTLRVLRGGAFTDDTFALRTTFRNMKPPEERSAMYGLRLVFPCLEPA